MALFERLYIPNLFNTPSREVLRWNAVGLFGFTPMFFVAVTVYAVKLWMSTFEITTSSEFAYESASRCHMLGRIRVKQGCACIKAFGANTQGENPSLPSCLWSGTSSALRLCRGSSEYLEVSRSPYLVARMDSISKFSVSVASGEFGYFVQESRNSGVKQSQRITKVRLANMHVIQSVVIDIETISCAFIDADFAYFIVRARPSKLTKFRLSDLRHIDTLYIENPPDAPAEFSFHMNSAVVHDGSGYLCGTNGIIARLNLKSLRIDKVRMFLEGKAPIETCIIHDDFGYFVADMNYQAPPVLVKFRLDDLSQIEKATLPFREPGQGSFTHAGFGYFVHGMGVSKVHLSSLKQIGSLHWDHLYPYSILYFVAHEGDFAYFAKNQFDANRDDIKIMKVHLGNMAFSGNFTLRNVYKNPGSPVIYQGVLYFGVLAMSDVLGSEDGAIESAELRGFSLRDAFKVLPTGDELGQPPVMELMSPEYMGNDSFASGNQISHSLMVSTTYTPTGDLIQELLEFPSDLPGKEVLACEYPDCVRYNLAAFRLIAKQSYRQSLSSALGLLGGFAGMLYKFLAFANKKIQDRLDARRRGADAEAPLSDQANEAPRQPFSRFELWNRSGPLRPNAVTSASHENATVELPFTFSTDTMPFAVEAVPTSPPHERDTGPTQVFQPQHHGSEGG